LARRRRRYSLGVVVCWPGQGEGGGAEEPDDDAEDAEPAVGSEGGGKLASEMTTEELLMNLFSGRRGREAEEASKAPHKFWDTQPVKQRIAGKQLLG
jgi:hypothetical protein